MALTIRLDDEETRLLTELIQYDATCSTKNAMIKKMIGNYASMLDEIKELEQKTERLEYEFYTLNSKVRNYFKAEQDLKDEMQS